MEPLSVSSRSNHQPRPPKLSICISTLNRAEFLRATIDRIFPQLTDQCEVLVVDNASADNTPHVVSEQMHRSERLRYVRVDTNNGMDSNFDRAVELARGDYCWLMSDDDLIMPGAVAAVLRALDQEPSAVVVNYEFRDFNMSKVLQARAFDFDKDRMYGPWEADRLFVELGEGMRFIGAHVIKRTIWLSRQRTLYVGSCYAFVGMIFQAPFPGPVHLIAQPCVSYRFGNEGTFNEQLMEIMLAKWPSLVASLPLLDSSKRKLHSAEPWRHFYNMLRWRGTGVYSYTQYRRWIRPQLRLAREKLIPIVCALLPPSLANFILTLYLSARGNNLRELQGFHLALMRATSPFHLWSSGIRMRHRQA